MAIRKNGSLSPSISNILVAIELDRRFLKDLWSIRRNYGAKKQQTTYSEENSLDDPFSQDAY
jgi:hypothetical protein